MAGREEPQCAACGRKGLPMTTNVLPGFGATPACSNPSDCLTYCRVNRLGFWAVRNVGTADRP